MASPSKVASSSQPVVTVAIRSDGSVENVTFVSWLENRCRDEGINITDATGVVPASGQAVVVKARADGTVRLIGTLPAP